MTPPDSEPAADGVRRPWWVPRLDLKTLLVLTALAALLVPQSWVDALNDAYARDAPTADATFSDEVGAMNDALLSNQPVDPARARSVRLDLYARRALACGQLTESEILTLKSSFASFDHELSTAGDAAGRAALRRVQLERLSRDLPRLRLDCLTDGVTKLDASFAAMGE
jgi:hypothetical protein